MKKFTCTCTPVLIALIEKHEILNRFGRRELDQFLRKEMKRYGMINRPIAILDSETGKYQVLTDWEHIEKASKDKDTEIELNVIDCSIGEAPRLYNYMVAYKNSRDYRKLHDLILYLKNYLNNTPEGKEWHEEMGGTLRKNLAYLIGYKDSMIDHILKVGKFVPEMLDEITAGEATWAVALEAATEVKQKNEKEAINKKSDTSDAGNTAPTTSISMIPAFQEPTESNTSDSFESTDTDDGPPKYVSTNTVPPIFSNAGLPELPSNKLVLSIESITDLELDIIDGQVTMASVNEKNKTGYRLQYSLGPENSTFNILEGLLTIVTISIHHSIIK